MSAGINWTEEQKLAINTTGCNVLVSASAGTGKTSVLVGRIINLIANQENPVDLDRLLVVTFTNAAAAEMRSRISQALVDELDRKPFSRRLRLQMQLINRSSIGTIHSFCLDLIRQNFFKIGLDPAIRVLGEDEAALLRAATCEELFELRYDSQENSTFTDLVDCYGGSRDDSELQELVLRLYDFARSTPDPQHWLKSAAKSFYSSVDSALDDLPWVSVLKKYLSCQLKTILQLAANAAELCMKQDGPRGYLDALQDDLVNINELIRCCGLSWGELHRAFQEIRFLPFSRAGKDVSEEIKKQVQVLRDRIKRNLRNLAEEFFSREPDEYLSELETVAPLVHELVELVLDFDKMYRQVKEAQGVVDFSDLEQYALQILNIRGDQPGDLIPSEVALKLQERFDHVLVDEYQDINEVQDAILNLVSRQGAKGSNLFMVGDVKQSVYRFRLAEPGLFQARQNSFTFLESETCRTENYDPGVTLCLTENMRSTKNIIDGVNFIFTLMMKPGVGEIDYSRNPLKFGAARPPEKLKPFLSNDSIEFHLLNSTRGSVELPDDKDVLEASEENIGGELQEDTGWESFEVIEERRVEARYVAGRIKEMVAEARREGISLSYMDMAVLMRSTIQAAGIFLEEFSAAGIPAYAESATGYFQASEVKTIISLLSVIDNPRQDIPLAGVLRSPLVGIGVEGMAKIRLCRKEGDFYDAVLTAAGMPSDELTGRLVVFLSMLEHWRTMSRQCRLPDLIHDIYRKTGYYDYTGGLPGGDQRQANLRALYDRACQYEGTVFRGLYRFLKYIERLQQNSRDLGSARALGENEDVVRIMSIHKSKGLEFPVVFIAGLNRSFNFQDLNRNILLHKKLGIGPQLVNVTGRYSYPTLPKLALKAALKMETIAEELRILYVAMTRAREKLILIGHVADLRKEVIKWFNAGNSREKQPFEPHLISAGSFLDLLGAALIRRSDAENLRQTAGLNLDLKTFTDLSRWEVKICSGDYKIPAVEEVLPSQAALILEKVQKLEPLDGESGNKDKIEHLLGWSYPFNRFSVKPAKMTVTGLKEHSLHNDEDNLQLVSPEEKTAYSQGARRPIFLQKTNALTGAEKGSAVHLVMRHLNLDGKLTKESICDQIADLQKREILTQGQADVINPDHILAFFESPLGERVLSANKIYRETPFLIAVPAHEIYSCSDESDSLSGKSLAASPVFNEQTVVIQGIIDCLLEEEGALVVIDFKTDYINPGDWERMKALAACYRIQIEMYARAAQTIFMLPVKERFLYFFGAGSYRL
ncbi:MAG: ATP-dependent helicase/nuclease subunit A [Desulfotomaculum sp. 46_296]|nr:MAG: ATP-dependent helicase/nuclease subunit A [Desulfotomaculum sp. 46_296]